MKDLLEILRLARAEEAAHPPTPVVFEVVISPWWRNPYGRVSVGRRDGQPPTIGERQYLWAVEHWLIQRFNTDQRLWDTGAVEAMRGDLEPMIRGALLKVARGDTYAPFSLTEDSAQTTPVRLLSRDAR